MRSPSVVRTTRKLTTAEVDWSTIRESLRPPACTIPIREYSTGTTTESARTTVRPIRQPRMRMYRSYPGSSGHTVAPSNHSGLKRRSPLESLETYSRTNDTARLSASSSRSVPAMCGIRVVADAAHETIAISAARYESLILAPGDGKLSTRRDPETSRLYRLQRQIHHAWGQSRPSASQRSHQRIARQ